MELNGIVQSLRNKSILVTGSTGFLSKLFVEKLLRIQPNMKQLFLLLRPADTSSATQRLHNDGVEEHGQGFDSFISKKVTPIFGDISLVNLGIEDFVLKEKMHKELDIVANFAETTSFDERYDVALDVNTMGAKHVLDFTEKCENLEMILHLSTAYIYTGQIPGIILEKPFDISETMKETSKFLDIEEERKLVQERLNELKAAQVSKKQETTAMKELGLERAKLYGWPNTYVFTKAMGEMILNRFKRSFPVVIARPTLVSSTYREPFPGWIEGFKTFDPVVISLGKGKIPCFLLDHESLVDIIPGDRVVNAVIVAMMNHYIYHMGSSAHTEPMNGIRVLEHAYDYFIENPWMGKDENTVKIDMLVILPTMASFRQHIYDNYVVPMKERKIGFVKRFVELYEPYVLFKRIMSVKAKESEEADMFDFDPKCIKWKDYFTNIHIPDVIKYVVEGLNGKN
ncbi:hypothetical protein MKW94_021623 [Papaver nudicaule]|uniref:Fatty acyl-CoA reductase n=1 Tax=Papaver nudicaule TaxID=74823 RepID=A0AA41VGD6_PAPNU|nr:hypothetical protein [Papaver nudicaule]